MRTQISLSPESHTADDAPYWATFSDVALAMLLVLLLFILAQFLHYERIFVLEEIQNRKELVGADLQAAAAARGVGIQIINDDDLQQRVRVRGELVFPQCSDELTTSGRALIVTLGHTLNAHESFFSSVAVEGHADRQAPTGRRCVERGITDNWQLSARRATEVVRVLSVESLVADQKLSSVGRGQFQSLSSRADSTAVALERDRRIEIVLRYSDNNIVQEQGGA